MPKTTSFEDLCRQFSNTMADLMEHPECPMTLRHMLYECAMDVQAESEADVDRARELVEVRSLMPLYLIGYQSKPRRGRGATA
jgi:hypothetical protein